MQTFKVGDWIKEPNNTLTKLKEIPELNSYYAEECVLWQPKQGEWCWFWNEYDDTPTLSRFLCMYSDDENGLPNGFDFCEPFIGQLPTILQSQPKV